MILRNLDGRKFKKENRGETRRIDVIIRKQRGKSESDGRERDKEIGVTLIF